jgi:hypothetical protein
MLTPQSSRGRIREIPGLSPESSGGWILGKNPTFSVWYGKLQRQRASSSFSGLFVFPHPSKPPFRSRVLAPKFPDLFAPHRCSAAVVMLGRSW